VDDTPSSAERDPHIAVIGLGYVGLPLALDLLEAGYRVTAIDADSNRLARLRTGDSYIDDVKADRLLSALASNRFVFATPDDRWTGQTAAFICVPTPLTASLEPDLGPVLAAGRWLSTSLRTGDLVVLQSTTFPGTTIGHLKPVLEEGGLEAGRDFGLAFAPERVSPGDGRPASTIPRLVGGVDADSTRRAARILERISPEVIEMSSPDAAELAKLFENVFRNVNIALVNELALICERLGLDVWEVIRGASTKPFGFMPFQPGPGVGGHCIPVDPYYLAARAREVGFRERFISTAADINSQMPEHVVRLVAKALNHRGKALRGSSVLIIGVAFKPNVSDARNSPAGPVIAGLLASGAEVAYHDPRLPQFDPLAGSAPTGDRPREVLSSMSLDEALDARPDVVVILTPHDEIDWSLIFDRADVVVDTRDASHGSQVRAGQVLRLGAGWS
jgi:UDP-N-acetyl-D-glucosamine dehydrogenase